MRGERGGRADRFLRTGLRQPQARLSGTVSLPSEVEPFERLRHSKDLDAEEPAAPTIFDLQPDPEKKVQVRRIPGPVREGIRMLLGAGRRDFLSVGEGQRVALARAPFRDAPFVILDEPTAALDPRAEHELFRRIRTFLSGCTVLLISHRFSLLCGSPTGSMCSSGAGSWRMARTSS